MSFNEFSDFMPTDNTDGILLESGEVLVSYDLGNGEVELTLNELAEELDLDPLVLRDYYIKYNGNLNVAILGAQNDKNVEDSVDFVRHALGITYIVEHNIQDIIRRYNKLLGIKTKVLKQLEYFMAFNNGNKDAKLSITGDQLKTLMLRSITAAKVIPKGLNFQKNTVQRTTFTPISVRKTFFDVASKKVLFTPLYATDDKVTTMEAVIRIADGTVNENAVEDMISVRRSLSYDTSKSIIASVENPEPGLSLASNEVAELYELFTTYQISLNKNVEVFECLSESYGLNGQNEKYPIDGPRLRYK